MDEYFETKKKIEHTKDDFRDLSSKFRELKSLVYEYKETKEDEINKLNLSHQKFKDEIEINQKKYEQLIDNTTDKISNFVKKTKLENKSQ